MKKRRLLQFQSIHTNIALAFSCLILCTTILLSFTSYRLSSDAVTKNSLEYTTELINQVNTNIQTYIGNMESISALALQNDDLKHYLSMSNSHSVEGTLLADQISDSFHSIVASRKDIASIMFVGTNGIVVSDRSNAQFKPYGELLAQEWFTKATETKEHAAISSSHVQHIYQNEYRWVVSISQQMSVNQASGVLLVDLNYNVINDLCKKILLGKRGYIFIVDPEGDIIYHPQQQIIYTHLKTEDIATILTSKDSSIKAGQNNQSKIYTIHSTSFGWKIIGVSYPDELVGNKQDMQFSAALWGFISLVIGLVISVILSLTLTKPIKNLDSHMKQVEKGDFDTRVNINSSNEIGKLARTFNLMIGKIKELMDQIVKEQEMKRISELKALQAQIQPHFLYNTLDSIIWMAEMGKVEEVVKMTSALSKLLRSSISKGEELISIAVELAHIENYLTIQNIRYRNKFTYSVEIDPEILSFKILKIVLQPLVENAIYHGIKNRAEAGHIRITGERIGDIIEIKVSDDGLGMRPEKARLLLINSQQSEDGKGIALLNVNHRIQLYFGSTYGLEFISELEEGTTAILRIPVIDKGVKE